MASETLRRLPYAAWIVIDRRDYQRGLLVRGLYGSTSSSIFAIGLIQNYTHKLPQMLATVAGVDHTYFTSVNISPGTEGVVRSIGRHISRSYVNIAG